MIKSLKALAQGFSGGPDFTLLKNLRFTLGDKLLTLRVPTTNVAYFEPEQPTDFPYRDNGWFDKHSKRAYQHHYTHVNTELWMYVPNISIGTSTEYGVLGFQVRISRLPNKTDINIFDTLELATHVIDVYDNHHNGPVDDNKDTGSNTKILIELQQFAKEHASSYDEKRFNESLKIRLAQNGFPPLAPAKIITFNHVDWVFYSEIKGISKSRKDYYCLALDERHYIECCFNYRVDRSDKFKKWEKSAEKAQHRLMSEVILSDREESVLVEKTIGN